MCVVYGPAKDRGLYLASSIELPGSGCVERGGRGHPEGCLIIPLMRVC